MLNRMISITPIKMIMIFSVWSVAKSNIQVIKADGSLVEQLSTNPTDVQNNDPNQKLFWAHGHQSRPSVGEFDVELSTSSPKEILEIDKMQHYRICPDLTQSKGLWKGNTFFSVDNNDCLISQSPDLTRTITLTYERLDDLVQEVDSVLVLVNQKLISLNSVRVSLVSREIKGKEVAGHYLNFKSMKSDSIQNFELNKVLMVDKTEVTYGDFNQLWKFGKEKGLTKTSPNTIPQDDWDKPASNANYRSANERSLLDGLQPVFVELNAPSEYAYPDHLVSYKKNLFIDTCANGYRFPFMTEWAALIQSGQSSTFYWGESTDSSFVSKYENLNPTLEKVGKRLPNQYGLYDTFGNAAETVLSESFYYRSTAPYDRIEKDHNMATHSEISILKLRFKDDIMAFRNKAPLWILKSNPGSRFVRQIASSLCFE